MATGTDRIIFPLDVATRGEAEILLRELAPHIGLFKVGLELFVEHGPAAVQQVHESGKRCFLDLKLHDIPETVERSVRRAVEQRVRYLTVHALGGPRMLERAAAAAANSETTILAVTILTSSSDADVARIGLNVGASEAAVRLATMARQSGIRAFVCSPHECERLKRELGNDIELIVPGVRPVGATVGDQSRVATPSEAILAGADKLVIGRPIRDAANRVAVARAIADEIAQALRPSSPELAK